MKTRGHTREALLQVLRLEFETSGYDGTTLSQLASATGLSKASLYHHFPGGKAEMGATLLRESVAELEQLAFSKLTSKKPANERLTAFLNGFQDYTRDGEGNCLVLVLSTGNATRMHGATIASQYEEWLRRLTATYTEAGFKPKRAERLATELLSGLYGHLLTAHITNEPKRFLQHVKRLKKQL